MSGIRKPRFEVNALTLNNSLTLRKITRILNFLHEYNTSFPLFLPGLLLGRDKVMYIISFCILLNVMVNVNCYDDGDDDGNSYAQCDA